MKKLLVVVFGLILVLLSATSAQADPTEFINLTETSVAKSVIVPSRKKPTAGGKVGEVTGYSYCNTFIASSDPLKLITTFAYDLGSRPGTKILDMNASIKLRTAYNGTVVGTVNESLTSPVKKSVRGNGIYYTGEMVFEWTPVFGTLKAYEGYIEPSIFANVMTKGRPQTEFIALSGKTQEPFGIKCRLVRTQDENNQVGIGKLLRQAGQFLKNILGSGVFTPPWERLRDTLPQWFRLR